MIIGQGGMHIELTLLGTVTRGQPDTGDLQFAVGVQCGDFLGRSDSVWIDAGAWDRFRAELRALERTRRGTARLASMSPAYLELRIAAVDRAGHLAVEGHVGDYVVVEQQSREVRLAFAFVLDPGWLPSVVRDVESLALAV